MQFSVIVILLVDFLALRTVTCENVTNGMRALPTEEDKCLSCRREETKARNIRAIKEGILKKLGYTQPVNLTGKVLPPIPKHLLAKWEEDYRQYQNDQMEFESSYEEDDDFHIKTEKIITFAQSYPHIRHSKGRGSALYFNLTDGITKFRVANASLYVFVRGTQRRPQPIVTLEVFKLCRQDAAAAVADGPVRTATKKVVQPKGEGDWFGLDATVMMSEWFKNSDGNFGFAVNATVEGKRFATDAEPNRNVPYAEINVSEPRRRVRRQSLNCEERNPDPICCRYPLEVNFETFGWDFIIAPKRYDAHYCSGECSYLTLQKSPHTHLATMAAPQVVTPCCAPRKLSPITMLYFDKNSNVVYGSLPGMVVDRCGCS